MSIPLVRRAFVAASIILAATACGSAAGTDSDPAEGLPDTVPGIEIPPSDDTCLAGEPRCENLGAADEPLGPVEL